MCFSLCRLQTKAPMFEVWQVTWGLQCHVERIAIIYKVSLQDSNTQVTFIHTFSILGSNSDVTIILLWFIYCAWSTAPHSVYHIWHAHGFIVLCFTVVMLIILCMPPANGKRHYVGSGVEMTKHFLPFRYFPDFLHFQNSGYLWNIMFKYESNAKNTTSTLQNLIFLLRRN